MRRSRPVAPVAGGYAKKAKDRVVRRPIEVPAPPPKPPKPIPPGGWEAVVAKHALTKHLRGLTTLPFVVSIDEHEGQWILVVRGYEPPFSDFSGFPVVYRQSAFIRNPLSRARMMGDVP